MDFKALYKKGVDLGEQQQQRQLQLLSEQKRRRLNVQDENRQLEEELSPELAECEQGGNSIKKQPRKWQRNNFNQEHRKLQQSEWLRQRPDNLCDWLLVPCPVGKRCLVIASHGRTKVYNKAGRLIMQLRTMLPGDGHVQKSKTELDCVYVEAVDSFYVLDALAFGQQQLLECEASFRFYWLNARFGENVELGQRSKRNEKPFVLLPNYDLEDAPAVTAALQRYPHWPADSPQLDGLLFYHKEASYTCGTTPLVCWLFAFMLPDVLDMPVNPSYEAPKDYAPDYALVYMEEFDRKLLEQRKAQQKRGRAAKPAREELAGMEVGAVEDEEDDDLQRLLEQERCLELGEEQLTMECGAINS